MQMQIQKKPRYETLKSSSGLGWSTLLAEHRSYHRGEGPGPVAPHVHILMVLDGSDEGIVGHKVGGHWHTAALRPGLIWVKPAGGKYDEAYVTPNTVRVLSLHLTANVFTQLSDSYGLPAALDRCIRYESATQDQVINQIGLSQLFVHDLALRREITSNVVTLDDRLKILRGMVVPIGFYAYAGLVAVGCERSEFPTETDRMLLTVAANHAATAFRSANLIHEVRRAEGEVRKARDELEMKVAERTAELQGCR